MIIITYDIGGVDLKPEKNYVSFSRLEVFYGNDTSNETSSLEIELKKYCQLTVLRTLLYRLTILDIIRP